MSKVKVTRFECPSKFQNSSHQKPQGQFDLDFMCLWRTIVYITGPGHMTKMAAMLIYSKK